MKLGPHGKFLVEYVMSFVNDDIARWELREDIYGLDFIASFRQWETGGFGAYLLVGSDHFNTYSLSFDNTELSPQFKR